MNTRRARTNRPGPRLIGVLCLLIAQVAQLAQAEIPNDVIGRLFLSPGERAKIEKNRGKDSSADVAFGAVESVEPVKSVEESLALNGLVRRADGNDIVWINGQIIGDRLGDSPEVKVRQGPDKDNSVVVESAGIPRPVRLKPGQAWDRNTNTVVDCFRCTSINVADDDEFSDEENADE